MSTDKLPPNNSNLQDTIDRSPTSDPVEIDRRLALTGLSFAMDTQRSIRRVNPDPVPDYAIRRCIELALEAPTGSNGQNWHFIVVRDSVTKTKLGDQYRRAWKIYGSVGHKLAERTPDQGQLKKILASVEWQIDNFNTIPVLIVCCLSAGHGRVPFIPLPPNANSGHYGSIYPSIQNLLLAARAIGLGASLITLPLWSEIFARKILGLPLTVEPCAIVALGWPKGKYGPKARKSVETVIHTERFGSS